MNSRPAQVIVFPVESPAERAAHSAVAALDDLGAAIWTAKTKTEVRAIRDLTEELIHQLNVASSAALTLIEHWKE